MGLKVISNLKISKFKIFCAFIKSKFLTFFKLSKQVYFNFNLQNSNLNA